MPVVVHKIDDFCAFHCKRGNQYLELSQSGNAGELEIGESLWRCNH